MPKDAALSQGRFCKTARDSGDTYGFRGAGSSWQASFGMALNEADLLFAVRREPVANRIVFQVAHDIFDNWFRVEEVSEKPDASFDKEVQKTLSALNAKAVFTQFAVYERLFGCLPFCPGIKRIIWTRLQVRLFLVFLLPQAFETSHLTV
ncbi:MAG: hypothetical protein QXZ70_05670 [Candidatus Bathyarchaeia archaeon]